MSAPVNQPRSAGVADSLEAQAQALGVCFFDADDLANRSFDFSLVTPLEARERGVLPLARSGRSPLFVISDPANSGTLAWLAARTGAAIDWALAEKWPIDTLLARSASTMQGRSESGILADPESARTRASPVVAFVDRVVADAWKLGASDIHFETRRTGLDLKYRLDGVLVEGPRWTGTEPAEEVLSRIKVMADLDIAERRVPQDGRFTKQFSDRAVDVRVSVMPNVFGEDAVLRILDKQHLLGADAVMSLESLGFQGDALAKIRSLSRRPHGMLLVTGPTGSGKTTTLYAAISETLSGREKVITIEDPIEYELAGVLQIPVNEKKGLTFSRGLRSILRHDPDTIFVGEIRDAETADIAIQSALTGHLVFTTVHANDVLDVIGRFLHMKVDMFSFMSALNGVVSQRLIRLLCTKCAQSDNTAAERLAELGIEAGREMGFRKAVGCEACRGTGYAGRTVVCEALRIDDQLRDLVLARRPVADLKAHIASLAGRSLRAHALELVERGQTGFDEVERVLAFA